MSSFFCSEFQGNLMIHLIHILSLFCCASRMTKPVDPLIQFFFIPKIGFPLLVFPFCWCYSPWGSPYRNHTETHQVDPSDNPSSSAYGWGERFMATWIPTTCCCEVREIFGTWMGWNVENGRFTMIFWSWKLLETCALELEWTGENGGFTLLEGQRDNGVWI